MFRVLRAFKVPLDLLDLQVIKAFKVPMVLQDLKEIKGFREHREFRVLKASKVLQVCLWIWPTDALVEGPASPVMVDAVVGGPAPCMALLYSLGREH